MDSGIDVSHPEFAGKTIHFQAFETSGARKALKAPKDYGDHGTHVAAICAGVNIGVAPAADLAVAAVLTTIKDGRSTGYLTQILAGLNWLAQGGSNLPRGVDVINASVGGSSTNASDYYQAISDCHQDGTLMIASVGNNGALGVGSHTEPGKFDCVVSVGAIDSIGHVATFSAWGPAYSHPIATTSFKPDLVAPGVGIVSAAPGGGYVAKDGTSMACPIVTGAAALAIQADGALRGEPENLAARLFTLINALPNQPNGFDARRGGRGRLDLAAL